MIYNYRYKFIIKVKMYKFNQEKYLIVNMLKEFLKFKIFFLIDNDKNYRKYIFF